MGVRVKVAQVAEVEPGQGRVVEVGGHTLAVFNVDGQFYVIDNSCSHRGGPLGEGDLDGRVVTCPWHGWRWDVTTGANANNPALKVGCFVVSVENGQVFAEMTGSGGA